MAVPLMGSCSLTPAHLGRRDTDRLVDGGHDVIDVMELVAQRAAVGDAVGPVHDERDVDTALMGVLLVPPEGGVARLRPSPGVVRMAVRSPDVVDALDGFGGRLEEEVEELHLVHDAERATLLTRAVVGQQEDHRVVQPVEPFQRIEEPTDLVVGVVEEGGEGLLETGGQTTVDLGHGVPFLDPWVPRGELGPRRHHARLQLLREPALAGGVPAVVESPAVLLQVGSPAPGAGRASHRRTDT